MKDGNPETGTERAILFIASAIAMIVWYILKVTRRFVSSK